MTWLLRTFGNTCMCWKSQGELIRIKKPVDTNLEIGKILQKIYSEQGPAVIFENPVGSDVPFLGALYSNRRKALLAFESDEEHILDKILTGMKKPVAPVLRKKARARKT